jgi:Fe-S-cluster formation regulator IscX/YfhJ
MRMRHIVMWTVRHYNIFPLYFINGTILGKKLLKTKCVFWFPLQLLSQTFLILRRNERDMIKYVYWSSCKVPVIIFRFWWNFNFLDSFSKSIQISNFTKTRQVGAELFHAYRRTDGRTDGRTDMTKLVVDFRNFANAPKKTGWSINKSIFSVVSSIHSSSSHPLYIW